MKDTRIKTRMVNGFSLVFGYVGDEWSCDHRQLGEKLGYDARENYKGFVRFIDALREKDPGFQSLGDVSQSCETSTTSHGRVHKARTLHLTRKQALYVIAKSDKPNAALLTLAMVEAFDMILSGAGPNVSYLLRATFCRWDEMWGPKILSALCAMYRHPYVLGASPPQWLKSPMRKISRLVWGEDVYKAVKALNNNPRHRSNHHQLLVEQARERFRGEMPFIEHTALDCMGNKTAFWARLEHAYAGHQLQLRLTGVDLNTPRLLGQVANGGQR